MMTPRVLVTRPMVLMAQERQLHRRAMVAMAARVARVAMPSEVAAMVAIAGAVAGAAVG